jgi:hypothetical protein
MVFPEEIFLKGNIITRMIFHKENIITKGILPNPAGRGSVNDILYRKLKASKSTEYKTYHMLTFAK